MQAERACKSQDPPAQAWQHTHSRLGERTCVALVRAAAEPLHVLQGKWHAEADAHPRQGPAGGGAKGGSPGGGGGTLQAAGPALQGVAECTKDSQHSPPTHLDRPGASAAGKASLASTAQDARTLPSGRTAKGREGDAG